jgi:hypothetical protein
MIGQQYKAERCFASRILDPADGIWAGKATEIADTRSTAHGPPKTFNSAVLI